MKPVERSEILTSAEYAPAREQVRARILEATRRRRVPVGAKVAVVFENHDARLFKVQEKLHSENVTGESAIAHALEACNTFLPDDDEVSCTLTIEIADEEERRAFLAEAADLVKHVSLVIGGDMFSANARSEKTGAVNHLTFPLGPRALGTLRSGASSEGTISQVAIVVEHPKYQARGILPVEAIISLGEDLGDDSEAVTPRP